MFACVVAVREATAAMAGSHRNFRRDAATRNDRALLSAPERSDSDAHEVRRNLRQEAASLDRSLNDGDRMSPHD